MTENRPEKQIWEKSITQKALFWRREKDDAAEAREVFEDAVWHAYRGGVMSVSEICAAAVISRTTFFRVLKRADARQGDTQ